MPIYKRFELAEVSQCIYMTKLFIEQDCVIVTARTVARTSHCLQKC